MRCYDAIIRDMEESSAEIKNPCARQTKNVEYLQEKLQKALQELDEMAELAEAKDEVLVEATARLRDDLKFQNESVLVSIGRDAKPANPPVVYTFMVTTASGNVVMEFNKRQFHSIAEIFRLQKLMSDQAQDAVIDYREVSICERDLGTEVTLHT